MATITNTNMFSPIDITGCALWLDAADQSSVVLSGSNVTQWNDKSGNGRHATPTGGPTYSTSNISLVNSSYFRGSISIASGPLLTTAFCVVITPASFGTVNRILSVNASTGTDFDSPTGFVYSSTTSGGAFNTYRSLGANTIGRVAINTRVMTTTLYNSNGVFTISINGNFPSGSSSFFVSNTNSSNTNALINYNIGVVNTLNTQQRWLGSVNEFIIYNRTLSQSEYQQVEGYLAWKWNLQTNLPISHPFYYNPSIPNLILPTQVATTTSNSTLVVTDPRQVSGCALWLDAADSSTVIRSGSNVTQWNDKSGNNNNAVTLSNLFPTYNSISPIVNLPSVRFTATNWSNNQISGLTLMVLPNFQNTFNVSIFYVSIPYTNINMRPFFILKQTGGQTFIETQTNTVGISLTSPSFSSSISIPLVINVPCINSAIYNSSLSNFNGGQNGSNTSVFTGTSVFSTSNATTITLGGFRQGSFQNLAFNGELLEVIVYNNSLTTAQRQQIEGYLAWKWGLQANLQISHPYYYNPLIPNLVLQSQILSLTPYFFNPSQVSGCALWLDAADTSRMTLSGSNISQYRDKSANQIILSNSTSANQPTLVTDTNNMLNIEFNGTTQFLTNRSVAASNLTLNNEVTLFFVHSPTNSQNSLFTLGNYSISGGIPRINVHTPEITTNYRFDYNNPTTGRITAVVPNYLTSGRRLDGGFKRGTTQVLRSYGTTLASRIDTNTITGSSTLPLTVGWFLNLGGYYYRGRLCELVWYNRGLSDTEINQVEGYLAWKWNLQSNLPSTHPFILFPPG